MDQGDLADQQLLLPGLRKGGLGYVRNVTAAILDRKRNGKGAGVLGFSSFLRNLRISITR